MIKLRFGRAVAAVVAVLSLAAAAHAGNVSVTQQGGGVTLSDDDTSVTAPRPADTASTKLPQTAGGPATVAKPAAAGGPTPMAVAPNKPDPRLQHRENMLRDAEPENYMSGNPAVSRRYLMIDRKTFEQRNGN